MRIVFLSTSVGPLGSGIGGGVELTLRTLAHGLSQRGHHVTVVAPRGSVIDRADADGPRLIEVDGELHVPSQTLARSAELVVPRNSVLVNMWQVVVQLVASEHHDIVLNFAYDAHPFVHARECTVPTAHLVSMGSLSDEMDRAVLSAVRTSPRSVAMHSKAQADTFGAEISTATTIVSGGVNLDAYEFVAQPTDDLALVARISREKGIVDGFEVAERSGRRLRVFGVMEDEAAWDEAKAMHPRAQVEHVGFLSTNELQSALGRCAALIMVHRWVEAFGNVAVEALACGVPVITYDRGGPAEIVRDGVTGFVVPPDRPDEVAAAVAKIGSIDRGRCRAEALERFSAPAFAHRVEDWLRGQLA
jgi:UDP-glucose:tetrahydrobiopterin glucosyltransferase